MKVIFSYFTTLIDSIVALIEFLISLLRDVVYLVGLLAEMLPVSHSFFTWLPAGLTATLGMTLAVVVVLRVLGRDG